jgi:hypothetical protein
VIGLGRRNRSGLATLTLSTGDHWLGRRRRGLSHGLMAPGAATATAATATTTVAATATARAAATAAAA